MDAPNPFHMKEEFNPDLFVAKWFCGRVGPEDMPRFAADALEAGYDGEALRKLAGLVRPTSLDVGNLFRQTLHEIGNIKILTREQAVFAMSRITATDIIEGRVEPIQGAEILARYAGMLNYPPYLAEFLQLSEMPHWGKHAPNRQTLIEAIIDQARELLANVPE
jgi:hypothetical protein